MIDFMITYWFATVPTAVTGVLLLGMLKKMRDEKTKKGKIFKGSFGKSRLARPAQAKKANAPVVKQS